MITFVLRESHVKAVGAAKFARVTKQLSRILEEEFAQEHLEKNSLSSRDLCHWERLYQAGYRTELQLLKGARAWLKAGLAGDDELTSILHRCLLNTSMNPSERLRWVSHRLT